MLNKRISPSHDKSNMLNRALQKLAQKATQQQKIIASAESCTGGRIAAAITSQAGSSAWFAGTVVSYSNAVKQQLLGVSAQTLKKEGAVSQQTVLEMLQGILTVADVNLAVASSGIAGPDGGTVSKPVGTVWLAWGDNTQTHSQCYCFKGTREQIQEQACYQAIINLCDFIK